MIKAKYGIENIEKSIWKAQTGNIEAYEFWVALNHQMHEAFGEVMYAAIRLS